MLTETQQAIELIKAAGDPLYQMAVQKYFYELHSTEVCIGIYLGILLVLLCSMRYLNKVDARETDYWQEDIDTVVMALVVIAIGDLGILLYYLNNLCAYLFTPEYSTVQFMVNLLK
jgi:hypothetical protein